MNPAQLFLISAPSGAGKTSLVKAALERDDRLAVSVSHTTRKKRDTETEGVNYYFVEREEFESMVHADAFLEHARVFGQHYGTTKAEVERLQAQGKDVVLEIDWQGAEQIHRVQEGTIGIFILPPSLETLQQRLRRRGQNSPQSMARRLAEARLEISKAPQYQYIVINDDFETALEDVLAIIRTTRLRGTVQVAGNEAVRAILSES